MPRATVNGVTPAESDHTEVVEGNHYFPPESVNLDFFRQSGTRTHRPWKGAVSHYTVEVGGERVDDAAWYYPEPKDAVSNIKDHVAFYGNKVRVESWFSRRPAAHTRSGYDMGGERRSAMDERNADRAKDAAGEFEKATRESYKAAVDHAFEAQKDGMRLSRRFFENWLETLEDQTELNRRTLQGLQELVREQREVFNELSRDSLDAYDGFLDSLSSYQEDVSDTKESED